MGSYADDLTAKLKGLGYTGSLNDMEYAYYLANGGGSRVDLATLRRNTYGNSGSLSDREAAWLKGLVTPTTGSLHDLRKRYAAVTLGALLFNDTFSLANQNGLGTSDSGHTWTNGTGWNIVGGRADPNISTDKPRVDVGSKNIDLEVIIRTPGAIPTGNMLGEVYFRYDPVGNTYLGAGIVWNPNESKVSLFKRNPNTDEFEVAEASVTLAINTNYTLRVQAYEERVKISLDGLELFTTKLHTFDGSAGLTATWVAMVGAAGPLYESINVRSQTSILPLLSASGTDSFDRIAPYVLGTSAQKRPWRFVQKIRWGIDANRAYQREAGYGMVGWDNDEPNTEVSVDLVVASGEFYIFFRCSNRENYYRAGAAGGNYIFQKIENNGLGVIGGLTSPNVRAPANGDRLRAVFSGNNLAVYCTPSGGAEIQLFGGSDAFNNTATIHGLAAYNAGASPAVRFDLFKVGP